MSDSVKLATLFNEALCKTRHLTVAYWDNYAGMLEKPFSSFSWNVNADFGWCPFVVSGSQIQLFKYRSLVVWSKASSRSPADVIRLCVDVESKHLLNDSALKGDSSVTGFSVHQSTILTDVFWHIPKRPNFFVCQRVCTAKTIEKALMVQEHLNSSLKQFMYSPSMLHMTLCTVSLANLLQVESCFELLRLTCKRMQSMISNEPLSLTGVDTFNGRVLYIKVQPNSQLIEMMRYLSNAFYVEGFSLDPATVFVPHITLLKFNRRRSQLKIDPIVLADHQYTDFGHLSIDELHLCLMGSARDNEGFYRSYGSIQFLTTDVSRN